AEAERRHRGVQPAVQGVTSEKHRRGFFRRPSLTLRAPRAIMANLRSLVRRRKAIRNIRKITKTMELIATARFKKALDRATEADAYTRKIAELAADLSKNAG